MGGTSSLGLKTVPFKFGTKTGAAVGKSLTVMSVAYSPNGQYIIPVSDDMTIGIWDAETGAAVGKPLKGHTGFVYSVAYSPDGKNIISRSQDTTIQIWNVETDAAVSKPLKGHSHPVPSVAFSPDGRHIIYMIPPMYRNHST